MTKYQGPNKEISNYDGKFVRVGEEILTTDPNDTDTSHAELAVAGGLVAQIRDLKESKPDEVDAGFYGVDNGDQEITLGGISSSLQLPVSENARSKTTLLFQKASQGYRVENI